MHLWWLGLSLLAPTVEEVVETVDLAPVWAGHPVGFALLTAGDRQWVAYYAADRQLTVAERVLPGGAWSFTRLDTAVGWDSHNYVTLAIDDAGHLHLSGNMHVVPLIYYRTTRPREAASLQRVAQMVGSQELRTTYPRFFRGPANEFIFTYRDGSSGNGNQIYNVWDHATQTWSRLLDQPLCDGQGERNAYLDGPTQGPDGFFHLVWVWRETGDAATNHDPSYARSRDLRHWTRSDGTPLKLPITLATGEIVDPIPVGGGVINGNVKYGWDAQQRPIVSYHKYDAAGFVQAYCARLEEGRWRIVQVSDWDYRWAFGGGGSIPFEIRVGAVRPEPDGTLALGYGHPKAGSGTWRLDPQTLRPIGKVEPKSTTPASLGKIEGSYPGLQVRTGGDAGSSGEAGGRYLLRWETLGPNRDRPRAEAPPPSQLRLLKLRLPQ
ncbi:MAG: BNR repeat-containing protein [Fimbriimonadaceae bacterium]|nr:BNR repeat-containing protein [Fimbriimonadaceae bacterium]